MYFLPCQVSNRFLEPYAEVSDEWNIHTKLVSPAVDKIPRDELGIPREFELVAGFWLVSAAERVN